MTNGPGSCFRLVFIGLLVVLLLASLYGGVITYQVNSLADFGNETPSPALTLRKAIQLANAAPPGDTVQIFFSETLADPGLLTLQSALPPITHDGVSINGAMGTTGPVPLTVLLPTQSASGAGAVFTVTSAGNTFQNLVVGGGDNIGFLLYGPGATGNSIAGCAVGTDPRGILLPAETQLSYGIIVMDGASSNAIGTVTTGGAATGNSIANCSVAGVVVRHSSSASNLIQANIIGSPGDNLLHGNRIGVAILDSPANFVGGYLLTQGNTIRGNLLQGILVTGPNAVNNFLGKNSLYRNGLLGIDLSRSLFGDGPNRAGRYPVTGPNHGIPAPVFESYFVTISLPTYPHFTFTVRGSAVPGSTVQLYEADVNLSGFGEGKTFLAEGTAGSDGKFSIRFFRDDATSIAALCIQENDTSEFSQAARVQYYRDIMPLLEISGWQSTLLLPVGFTRDSGFSLSRPAAQSEVVTLFRADTSFVSAPSSIDMPGGENFATFPVTALKPGNSALLMRLPTEQGNCFSGLAIYADDSEPVSLAEGPVERTGSLDSASFFRFYRFEGQAGDVVNVSARAAEGSPIFPIAIVFGKYVQNLAANSSFDHSQNALAQTTLPESGTYFVAVGDVFRRQGAGYGFQVKIWKESKDIDLNESFTPHEAFTTDTRPGCLALGDLNNDGYDDAALALPAVNRVQLRLKTPAQDASFQPPLYLDVPFPPAAVSIRDMNGDGWRDIVMAGNAEGNLIVFFNQEDFAKTGLLTGRAFWPGKRTAAASGGDIAATMDANGDEFPDYALLSSTSGTLQVFLNDTHGNLEPGSSFSAGSHPLAMAVDDLDKDGNQDLTVADNSTNRISLFGGQGNGTFVARGALEGFPAPVDVKAADLDNDSQPDIIVISGTTGGLKTWRGTGAFSFQGYQELASGTQPNSLAISDINGDGYQDAAVSCTTSQDIYVYEGGALGLLIPAARLTESGEIVQIFWYSFGITGSYIGVSPDEQFVQLLQQEYSVLDFPCADNDDVMKAAFAFANPSESDAVLTMSLYNPNGTLISDEHVINPVTVTVKAREQIGFYIADLFGASVSSYQPYLRAYSLNPAVQGFFIKAGATFPLRMDGATAIQNLSNRQVLPSPTQAGAGAGDAYSVANPGSATISVTLRCRNALGNLLGSQPSLNIDPNGRTAFRFSDYFPAISEPCYLELLSTQLFEAFVYERTDDLVCALNGLPAPDEATSPLTMFMPHFAVGRLYRSAMDLINTGTEAAQVQVTAYDDEGTLLAQSGSFAIPAGGLRRADVDDLLGIDSTAADVISGFLKVQSDRGGITGFLTFSDRQNGHFASTLPLQGTGGARWLFSHVAIGNLGGIDYFTGIAVLNAGTSATGIHFQVYDSTGHLKGEGDFTVPAGRKLSRMLTDFVPGLGAQAGGYVTLTASDEAAELLTYEMFGDYGFTFLAAVPAQPWR